MHACFRFFRQLAASHRFIISDLHLRTKFLHQILLLKFTRKSCSRLQYFGQLLGQPVKFSPMICISILNRRLTSVLDISYTLRCVLQFVATLHPHCFMWDGFVTNLAIGFPTFLEFGKLCWPVYVCCIVLLYMIYFSVLLPFIHNLGFSTMHCFEMSGIKLCMNPSFVITSEFLHVEWIYIGLLDQEYPIMMWITIVFLKYNSIYVALS